MRVVAWLNTSPDDDETKKVITNANIPNALLLLDIFLPPTLLIYQTPFENRHFSSFAECFWVRSPFIVPPFFCPHIHALTIVEVTFSSMLLTDTEISLFSSL